MNKRYGFDENITADEQVERLTRGVGDIAGLTREYWYIEGRNKKGQFSLIGPFDSEENADQIGFEKMEGNFKTMPFKTRSLARATSMWKAQQLKITANLDKATENVRHRGKGSGVRE